MTTFTLKTILLVAGLSVCSMATAGGRGTPAPPQPMILKTVVDAKKNDLIISGRDFGTTSPTVMLAEQSLDVAYFSEQEIVVNLPRSLASGTYAVTVITSGHNRVSSNLFSASLPDIGK